MNRKVFLRICICAFVGIFAACLLKSSKKLNAVSSGASLPPIFHPAIAVATIDSTTNSTFTNTEADATSLPVVQQTIMSVHGSEKEESAEPEIYQLLRSLRAWAEKDPEAALAAAMKLPEGKERNQALSAVCFGLAQTDPADAVKIAQTMKLDHEPGAVVESLVQQWAATDLSSALDWANRQPASDARDGFTTRIAYVLSQNNPVDAAKLVTDQISSGAARNEAVMMILNQWARQDLVAAATWVKGFPEGPLQARAVNELEGIANRQQTLAQH